MFNFTKRRARTRAHVAALAAALICVLAFAAASASAAVSTSYSGWGYATYPQGSGVASGLTSVPAWKWTSNGWVSTSFEFGTSARLYPFGSGWHWAYREGAWYALRDSALGTWSCDQSISGASIPSGKALAVRRYNASSSQAYGYVSGSVTFTCANSYPDAANNPNLMHCMAIGCGPSRFYLVKARPAPMCLLVAPRCMMPEPVGGFPEKVGYLEVPEATQLAIYMA